MFIYIYRIKNETVMGQWWNGAYQKWNGAYQKWNGAYQKWNGKSSTV